MKVSPASNERLDALLRTYWQTVLTLGSGEPTAGCAADDMPPPPRPSPETDTRLPS